MNQKKAIGQGASTMVQAAQLRRWWWAWRERERFKFKTFSSCEALPEVLMGHAGRAMELLVRTREHRQ